MTWVQTYSGIAFDLKNPRPELVSGRDIAHHLANQCRFKGGTRSFYSVAQHTVLGARIIAPAFKKLFTFHDSPEYVVGDWPRPMKVLMKELGILDKMDSIYNGVAEAIGIRYGVELVKLPPEVIHMDNVMLATEKRDLLVTPPQSWGTLPDPHPDVIEPWPAERAEREYLLLLQEVTGENLGVS